MNLQQIKTRINSIEETIKLTRALQFVATAKLHRLRREHVGIKQLAQALDGAFKGLRKHRGGELNFNFLGKRAGKPRTLFVTIYSNFGLCSSYNNLVTNHLQKLLKDEDLIVTFGNRSRSQLANFKQQIIKSYFDTNDSFTKLAITEISSELIDLIKADPTITKLVFVSTYFVNALTFIPASFVFLEADIKHSDQFKRGYHSQNESLLRGADFVLEPNSTELFLKQNLQFYLETLLAYTYSEAKLSEMSARRNAMESASDNAETLKRELELNYNRIRQASITQEISEIVAASLGEN